MSGPSSRPKQKASAPRAFVPHPDDVADVREALKAPLLSEEESADYLRSLQGEEQPKR
jgi:hypothetical protein